MKDWINPELFEDKYNRYDNRRKILTFPQRRLFVSESDPKEFKRFIYAIRGLVEAVEVTETGHTINKVNNWIGKILELDKQEVVRASTPAEHGQPAGSLLHDSEGNIIGIAGQTNPDGTVEVITTGAAQIIANITNNGGISWNDLAEGNIVRIATGNTNPDGTGDFIHESFDPPPVLNLCEIVVKFLRENGLWIENNYEGEPAVVKNAMPANLVLLSIEYDFGSQRVNFLVWSQYFEKNADGAIPMVHELVFVDLKSAKPVQDESGIRLRKLLIENEMEEKISE